MHHLLRPHPRYRALLAAAVLLPLAGCNLLTGPDRRLEDLPRPLTAAETRVIQSSNRFAFDLLREVNADAPGENVFLSPLSVSMALGMTMNGAEGTTFDEMRGMLGFDGMSRSEINSAYLGLMDLLLGLDRKVEMHVANSIWYRQGFPFEASFLDTVRGSFRAEVTPLDFGAPSSVRRVNDWVSSATRGRIPEILKEISPLDVMYLINAVYFKGEWVQRFDPKETISAGFAGLDGTMIPVSMMNTDGRFPYGGTAEYEAVDLPYGNGAFTMTILLPRPGADINEVVARMDDRRWREVIEGLREAQITVSMPRFRIELEEVLNEPLQRLGMTSAFRPGGADFSGMSRSAGRDLYVSQVLHRSFVEVNEQGTEAAAATKVTMRIVSLPPGIRVDRPFLFAIRERFSGTILFQGKIVDPRAR
jgi:serine protease inhibitor